MQWILGKIQQQGSALPRRAFGRKADAEMAADPVAEVQPQAAGALIYAAVLAGVAFFEDAGKILRGNPDTGIPNGQYAGGGKFDGHAARRRVLEGIGEQLFQHKDEIEAEIGFALDWRELPDKKASRILIEKTVNLDDHNEWISQFDWIIDMCIKFKKVFKKYI